RWSGQAPPGVRVQIQDMQAMVRSLDFQSPDAAAQVIEAGFGVMRYAYGLVENPFLEETLENFRPAISRTYYVALDRLRSEIPRTSTFFQTLADAATSGDAAQVVSAIRAFGERQRQQVLSLLQQETA
ncbi:MAG TPA: FCD domain-containing protein, partial [Marinobacter sp.]|nr:FCD domain-containing protein [Marinobacter sp.]